MENQRDKESGNNKGYTPDSAHKDSNAGSENKGQNLKWDQAQRRQQAGPRSYNESVDSENIKNQNTEAGKEQIENKPDDPNDPKMIGDQISERQQKIDEGNEPREKKEDRKRNE